MVNGEIMLSEVESVLGMGISFGQDGIPLRVPSLVSLSLVSVRRVLAERMVLELVRIALLPALR